MTPHPWGSIMPDVFDMGLEQMIIPIRYVDIEGYVLDMV